MLKIKEELPEMILLSSSRNTYVNDNHVREKALRNLSKNMWGKVPLK